jgi:GH24 family phage-related lysozyme (muramidase)
MRFNEFKDTDPLGLTGTIWDPKIMKAVSSGQDPSAILKMLGMDKSDFDPTSKDSSTVTSTKKDIDTTGTTGTRKKELAISSGSGKPSDELIEFIKRKEGFKSKAFWDYKQYTNGYGTKANSRNEVIDKAEADRRLREKAQTFYDIVVKFDRDHKYGFNDNQRDALTSFVFNGGPGWLNQVSANGKRSKEQIAQAMLNYTNAGSKQLPGLVRRRREEVAMFNAGDNKMPSSNMA